jgi:hypothetical protein
MAAAAAVAVLPDRADGKSPDDRLRLAISAALDSSLLRLSAIVAEYARTAYVDWDRENFAESYAAVATAVVGRTPSSALICTVGPDGAVSVALPETDRFVLLFGRRPFSDPLAVRRWSVAVCNPSDWAVGFGVAKPECKQAKDPADGTLPGALTVELPAGRMLDGPDHIAEAFSEHLRTSYVITCALDVAHNEFSVQAVQPLIEDRDDACVHGRPAAMAAELAKARDSGGGLPAGWTASEVLTVKVPAHCDLTRCCRCVSCGDLSQLLKSKRFRSGFDRETSSGAEADACMQRSADLCLHRPRFARDRWQTLCPLPNGKPPIRCARPSAQRSSRLFSSS